MSATTMSNYTGFTSDFVDRIGESRRRLDEFVESNKQKADSLVADVKRVEADEQQNVDLLLRQLKSLQYERGVAESAALGGGGGVGGIASQRKKLEDKQAKLEQEVSMLKSKNTVDQAQLDGASYILSPNIYCAIIFATLRLTYLI